MTIHHIEYAGEYTKLWYVENGVLVATFAPSADVIVNSNGKVEVTGFSKKLLEF